MTAADLADTLAEVAERLRSGDPDLERHRLVGLAHGLLHALTVTPPAYNNNQEVHAR